MAGYFELKSTAAGKFMFNLKAGNHEIILTSQQYTAKATAEQGIESVRTNAADLSRFDRRTSVQGDPYFALTAGNGQDIGTSQMYSSTAAMDAGIASVQQNAPEATVTTLASD